ncbi:MAG: hemolysin III family protein [Anaerolineales bacterium]
MKANKLPPGVIPPHKLYTRKEELANSITHGIGVALSIAGTILLILHVSLQGNPWLIASLSIYGFTLVLLYLASTLYHSFQEPRLKQAFQKFDHAAIYLLIAGTYTPFMLIGHRTPLVWSLLGVVWGIALLGVGFKTFFIHYYQRLSAVGYVFMGWLGVIAGRNILISMPHQVLLWLAIGGVFYTVGLAFAAWRRLPYSHTIWHLFVLGGSISHYLALVKLLGM